MLLQRRGRSHHLSGGVAEASPRPAAGRGAPTSPRAAPISGPRAGSTRVRAQTTSSSSTSVLPVLPYDLDEGVEQGIKGMRTGGKRRLLVPKNLAPPGVDVPDGVSLVYDVEVKEVLPGYF